MAAKSESQPTKKITLGLVLSWIFGVVFALAGLGGTIEGSFGFGIPLLLAGLVLLPPVRSLIREKAHFELSTGLLITIVIILLVISIVNTPSRTATATTADTSPSTDDATGTSYRCATGESVVSASDCPRVVKLGEPVQVGDLAWTLTGTRKQAFVGQYYGGTLMGEQADGVYLVVDVEVENTGKRATYISSEMLRLVDDQGRVFEPDTAAGIYLGDAGLTFDEINPGIVKKGESVFDVPKDLRVARVRISNGLYGTDTYVNLLG